jgi:hypothetical protein
MKYILITILLLSGLTVFGQQVATTEDGKKVSLKSDGTWEFIESQDKASNNSASSFDFRKSNWGMSKAQVKSSENITLVKEDVNLLAYSGNVSNLEVLVIYIFVEDKLVRTRYSFIEKHTNKNEYISDYSAIKVALTEKYGNPSLDKEYWLNDLYKKDYDQKGFAISLGHLKYFSEWETTRTKITSALTGDNYEISHVTEYLSKELDAFEEKKKKEKNKSDF